MLYRTCLLLTRFSAHKILEGGGHSSSPSEQQRVSSFSQHDKAHALEHVFSKEGCLMVAKTR